MAESQTCPASSGFSSSSCAAWSASRSGTGLGPDQPHEPLRSPPRRSDVGIWTCPHRTYNMEELSAEVDEAYSSVDLECCRDSQCKGILAHVLRWKSFSSAQSSRSKTRTTSTDDRETGDRTLASIETTVLLLSTIHHRTAETPRRVYTMRRDFTASRLHGALQEANMPICEHKTLGEVPVRGNFHVDFVPFRDGKYVYRTNKRRCFYQYWECTECRYGGTETAVGFEAKAVDRGESFGRDRRSIALTALITREVGLLGPPHSSTISPDTESFNPDSQKSLSRSSSWEYHAVSKRSMQRFQASWGQWTKRLRLSNEECGMRQLLEQLNRLATFDGGLLRWVSDSRRNVAGSHLGMKTPRTETPSQPKD